MDLQKVNSYWILNQCQHPFETFAFSSDVLDILFFELVRNCLTSFPSALLLGTIFNLSLSRIYSKQKSKYPKKVLRPVSFLGPL